MNSSFETRVSIASLEGVVVFIAVFFLVLWGILRSVCGSGKLGGDRLSGRASTLPAEENGGREWSTAR